MPFICSSLLLHFWRMNILSLFLGFNNFLLQLQVWFTLPWYPLVLSFGYINTWFFFVSFLYCYFNQLLLLVTVKNDFLILYFYIKGFPLYITLSANRDNVICFFLVLTLTPDRKTEEGCQFGFPFPGGASGKEPACQSRRHKIPGFDPWVRKIPWRRAWLLTPVLSPGESHEEKSLVGYSPWGHTELDTNEATSMKSDHETRT